jgi:hypothetical protein
MENEMTDEPMKAETVDGMEQWLRDMLTGYHFEISVYPSGGNIDIEGCDECGTESGEFEFMIWRKAAKGSGHPSSLYEAVEALAAIVRARKERAKQ